MSELPSITLVPVRRRNSLFRTGLSDHPYRHLLSLAGPLDHRLCAARVDRHPHYVANRKTLSSMALEAKLEVQR